jgi:La-related protein 7
VQARTVVAENLPIDYSVEKLEELFGKVGSVKMVRICHPETPNGGNQTAVKLPKSDMVISNKVGFPIPLLQNSEAIAVKSCGSQG